MVEGQEANRRQSCPTWQDHEWGAPVLIGGGTHPINGRWMRYREKCAACGREYVETKWITVSSPYGTAMNETNGGE